MSAKKPKAYWRRGHRYVRIQVELTEKQWQWLYDLDQDCQVGISGHVRFAVLQYRARIKQQQVELAKRVQKQTVAAFQNGSGAGNCSGVSGSS